MKNLLRKMFAYGLILSSQYLIIAHSMLDPIDFLALQPIRKSLSDLPGSNYFASWDFTSDPCNFPGVYCDQDKVIALNLGDPRAGAPALSCWLGPTIGKLSALAELTIVPGRVIGPLPNTLSQLKYLRFLDISHNIISGNIPTSLGQPRGHLRLSSLAKKLWPHLQPSSLHQILNIPN
ncbi:hypothetical protein CASFOL_017289 [Castilleja foliolosa]|uniref:Leucine-rich repeat-containing N-terminal plant-type domain-containing protein n=1 Tax=Castilleja foliolosa TaxID=1961234 RepID=A0ABD3DCI1_9LAMI